MSEESRLREAMVHWAASLHRRGFSVGSAGNISARIGDDILVTPTNSCLGFLDPARLAKVGRDGRHLSGDKPSKEIFLHQAFYETRPAAGAVVHLHSTYATAISCLADVDPNDGIPPLTPYVVMRVGRVPLLPYLPPGDPGLGDLIRGLGGSAAAVLLANHGPAVSAANLEAAVFASEELEETARLVFLTRGMPVRHLGEGDVAELQRRFGDLGRPR